MKKIEIKDKCLGFESSQFNYLIDDESNSIKLGKRLITLIDDKLYSPDCALYKTTNKSYCDNCNSIKKKLFSYIK